MATMPIYTSRRIWGRPYIEPPPLTRVLEPTYVGRGLDARENLPRESVRISLINDLLDQLPYTHAFASIFNCNFRELTPFVSRFFHVSVHSTYRIQSCTDTEQLWAKLHPTIRNRIRKASKHQKIVVDPNPERFVRFFRRNILSTGERLSVPEGIMAAVLTAAATKTRGTAIYCTENSQPTAGIYIVWDQRTMFLLLTSRYPGAQQGSVPAALWRAIQLSSERGLSFDFDFFKTANLYGSEQILRWDVRKYPCYVRIIQSIRGKM
jgi:hypothetical protein